MRKKLLLVAVVVLLFIGITVSFLCSDVYHSRQIVKAVQKDDISEVERLIEKYPEAIDEIPTFLPAWLLTILDVWGSYSFNPLCAACSSGNLEMVELLISKGADVNFQEPMLTQTPLIICLLTTHESKYQIAEVLLQNGADVTLQRSSNGIFDAMGACVAGMVGETDRSSGEALLKKMLSGIDPETYDFAGLLNEMLRDVASMEILFQMYSIDVDQYRWYSDTILICAVQRTHADIRIVRLLLENGAQPDVQDKYGKTAYDYAVERGHTEIADLLKQQA
ncbi:MAG: hypothetical protein E7620_00360 [Ruminococcaceae bacterium]|nr:hypothetical protein [Oscillospiraceae bacterium]